MMMMKKKNMMRKKVSFIIDDRFHLILCISGAQLLEKMIASVLKPKSRQKEAFIQVRIESFLLFSIDKSFDLEY